MPILFLNIALALLLIAALVGVVRPYGGRWGRLHFSVLAIGLALLLLVMGGLMVTERVLGEAAERPPAEAQPVGETIEADQPGTPPGQIV
ncbi:hypothetical protein GRI97_10700 [Altererythrobacter xixiisoli]|uniref:Uncharacterized protein n=1 Tax=Croceibacterium xixiisoli TaxID=1476466 RepID=A0A6I4TXB3_9SPHN|nr:hypothetical protein [Croceibacterium xixiisoli]MXO99457.1 hypothetical protein [Croceibacterium xixiisoli]